MAFGESLLVTGATFAESIWNISSIVGLLVAVLSSVALWWIYFDTGAQRANDRIAHSDDPGRQARTAYTYLHVLIVVGIIVCAVADELLLLQPGHATDAGSAVILGGPMLFLLGNALFKWVTNDRRAPPFSHLVGLLLPLGLSPLAFSHLVSALTVGALATGVLVLVAGWESAARRNVAGVNKAMDE